MSEGRTLVVVVTGLSGAGKSTAVHALEDLGFFCVDNLPTTVVEGTLAAFASEHVLRIALGIDVRVRGFLDDATSVLERIPVPNERDLSVLFLDASDEALLRRFSSTRRPHPLSTTLEPGGEQAAIAVLDGIRIERELLAPLRARATVVVDTTRLSVHELRRRIVEHFGPGAGGAPRMHTRIVSFGFKYGAPVDADLLFDVRFLQNPFFVPELSALPGTEAAVQNYVFSAPDAHEFLERTLALLEFCLPRFEREGKSYLTVGIGCTGGRHRSVVLAERIARDLERALKVHIDVVHRDVERVAREGGSSEADLMAAGPKGTGA
jgi:RNase adapter protein RapZ